MRASVAVQTRGGGATAAPTAASCGQPLLPRLHCGARGWRLDQQLVETPPRSAVQRAERILGRQTIEQIGAVVIH